MGNQSTKSPSGVGYFSAEEVAELQAELIRIAGGGDKTCSPDQFQGNCSKFMTVEVGKRLTQRFTVKSQKGISAINLSGFLQFLSEILLGSVEEKSKALLILASRNGQGEVTSLSRDEVVQYARTMVESYVRAAEKSAGFRSWKRELSPEVRDTFSEFLLSEALYPRVQPKDLFTKDMEKRDQFDLNDLIHGFSRTPLILQLQATVFSKCFNLNRDSNAVNLIPTCLPVKRAIAPNSVTTLDIGQIIFINSHLPSDCQQEWRFLFSTAVDGESFAKLLGVIQNQGSTVMIVKEAGGHTFGAFADASWALGPKFIGTEKCFLFHLSPKLLVYPSTGFNQNFQYLNVQQQTLPNGLGIGGKLEYFGLWLDAEFGKGRSAPSCTTFACPQLSLKQDFEIEALEVWAVGKPPVEEEGVRNNKSVLDKDPEARAMLELMNRAPASEGLREKKKVYEADSDDDT